MKENIIVEYLDKIALLKLNRAEVFNSLNVDIAKQFISILDDLEANNNVYSLVITGDGDAFCAGAELNQELIQGNSNRSLGENLNKDMEDYFNIWIIKLTYFPKPVIIALNGVAAGAGVGLALAGDIIIAAEKSYFLLTFMPKLGLIPDLGSSWQLLRTIGLARSKALTLTGEKLDAQKAKDWGVVWKVVKDEFLITESMKLASQLSSLPVYAKSEINNLYRQSFVNTLVEQLDYERIKQSELFDSNEFQEGVKSFMEKRKPQFKK
ncbi:hypothetical protein AMD27_05715 [Acinetobacter sp. TGL-Y2]|uniref:enoyl-CoA hydratase-related protein n=1 Tax=Acinetobacter sp. TGL-Y2 TaxID=1407071 RepID=UPI0007A67C16|nr:enoyl-CoA hydratase-related protein [Acinetobacter sp. TGL-Y2]AMW78429.1 hypothetical protein AMD27_05715 [Acinetobacter sp. TGL-Y2]